MRKENRVLLYAIVVIVAIVGGGYVFANSDLVKNTQFGHEINAEDNYQELFWDHATPIVSTSTKVIINGDKNTTIVCEFVFINNPFNEYNEGRYVNCNLTGGDDYISGWNKS